MSPNKNWKIMIHFSEAIREINKIQASIEVQENIKCFRK